MEIRTLYSPRQRFRQDNLDAEGQPMPSRAQKHLGNEADINTIVNKYQKTGLLVSMGQKNSPMSYGDFRNGEDFQSCQNRIIEAQEAFMAMPSKIREYFHNDPAQLFEFLSKEENLEMSYEMGLRVRPPMKKEDKKPLSEPESEPAAQPAKKAKKEVAE